MHYGTDVSSNNAHPIAWAAVYAHLKQLGGGAEPFLVVKLTEGISYVNPESATDVAGWRNTGGKATAGYQFDHGDADPAAEESFAASRSLGLPVWDDIEDPAGLTVAQYKAHAQGLVTHNPGRLRYYNQSEVQAGFPADNLWLAEYNRQPGVVSYPCLIHQYDSQGSIPGCAGTFDLNVWLGSDTQFDDFFDTPTPQQEHDMLLVYTPSEGIWLLSGGLYVYLDDPNEVTSAQQAGVKSWTVSNKTHQSLLAATSHAASGSAGSLSITGTISGTAAPQ